MTVVKTNPFRFLAAGTQAKTICDADRAQGNVAAFLRLARWEVRDLGVDVEAEVHFIQKPFSLQELAQKLVEVMGGSA